MVRTILDNLDKYRIVLASASPRRKELLAGLGIEFEVRVIKDIDESYPQGLDKEQIPLFISNTKAEAYAATLQADELVITADTIVWKDGTVYGKPQDEEEAKKMLRQLSGQKHDVVTGVTLLTKSQKRAFATTTEVEFDCLSNEEIDFYVRHFHPLDKAGAYGIQEFIGYIGVKSMNGSYFNVMGLPIQRLYKELKKM